MMDKKFIVTITPPTPNGDLHIGHIAGPFLSADIFTKVQRLLGFESYLVSYSDDYQSYMLRKAREVEQNALTLARENSQKIQRSLQLVDIQLNYWLESYDNRYFEQEVMRFYESLSDKGLLKKAVNFEPYCENCNVWGYEAFARGVCNHCGSSSDPSQCEVCAMAPDATNMTGLHCILCKQPMSYVPVERKFLQLESLAPKLQQRLTNAVMRPPLKAWLGNVFKGKLANWGVTRPNESGLKLYNSEEHRVHTWFMGQAGYFAALKALSEQTTENVYDLLFDENTHVVNFLGMDCSYSHVLVYPSQLLVDDAFKFKCAFYTNAFLKLNGGDFSTSRGHAIWVSDLVREACKDSVRFYLSLISPEEETSDFDLDAFWHWRSKVFGQLLPKLASTLDFIAKHSERSGPLKLTNLEVDYINDWKQHAQHNNFSAKKLSQILSNLLNKLAETDNSQLTQQLNLSAIFTILSEPIMPEISYLLQKKLSSAQRQSVLQLLHSATN